MPETEEIELRTDTVEQLVGLLEMTNLGVADFPIDRRMAVADRLRQQISRPDAIAFCGLPGAGKSYTAEKAADVYNAPVVSMGDAIREEAPNDLSSDELGEYAAGWRETDPEGIPEKVTEIADEKFRQHDSDLVIIDGVRSTTDYEVLNDYFDDFYLIEVTTPFYDRLSRLQDRGREGEASFSAIDLAKRDEREREDLGFGELCEYSCPDFSIENGTGPDQLAITLSRIVTDNLPFEIANGKPLGLDDELEGKRREMEIQAGGGPVGEA